jgi:hypothetical protein
MSRLQQLGEEGEQLYLRIMEPYIENSKNPYDERLETDLYYQWKWDNCFACPNDKCSYYNNKSGATRNMKCFHCGSSVCMCCGDNWGFFILCYKCDPVASALNDWCKTCYCSGGKNISCKKCGHRICIFCLAATRVPELELCSNCK